MNDFTPFRNDLVQLLPRLRRFALTLTQNRADGDDLVQAACERAMLRAAQWQIGTRLDSWTFTIMRRLFIDQGRARTRWGRVVSPATEATEAVADASMAGEGLRADALAVRTAIHALPRNQQLAVALVLIDGLSYAEAAVVAGVPAGTLTSRLVRARQTLIQTLAAQGVSA